MTIDNKFRQEFTAKSIYETAHPATKKCAQSGFLCNLAFFYKCNKARGHWCLVGICPSQNFS